MHHILVVLDVSLQNGNFIVSKAAAFGFLFFKNLHTRDEHAATDCPGFLLPVLAEEYHGTESSIRKELVFLIIYNVKLMPLYFD